MWYDPEERLPYIGAKCEVQIEYVGEDYEDYISTEDAVYTATGWSCDTIDNYAFTDVIRWKPKRS